MKQAGTGKARHTVLFGVFALGFAFLGGRAIHLQLFPEARVAQVQSRQIDRRVELPSQRGRILDARGRVLAATLRVPSVFADPAEVENVQRFARSVAKLLALRPEEVRKKLRDKSRRFVWLKRRIDPAVGSKVAALRLKGLHVMEENARLYPEKELAAQLIGLVGMDGDGLEGLERLYDNLLRSEQKVARTERDARGRSIYSNGPDLFENEQGADLYLTIDATIQNLAEGELADAARASGSKGALGLVLDVPTGRVLAMATYPSADPNRPENTPGRYWRNRPVEEVFEPGSTFKVFPLAAALESGVVRGGEKIQCSKGSLAVGGRTIRTLIEHDWLTPREILKYSDNIGASRIALKTGKSDIHSMLHRFGFGERTGVDFPQESRGLVATAAHWRALDLANISYGQGIGVTAIQMVAALASVAEGGFQVRPFVAERAVFRDGRTIDLHGATSPRRILSEETAEKIRTWMEAVTEKGGTGEQAAMPIYRVGGKTGTAQKIAPETGTYTHDAVMSSFLGFAPASNPRLVAFFLFDEPRNATGGGVLAAPVFRRVVGGALAYLGVASDRRAEAVTLTEKRTLPEEHAFAVASTSGFPDLRGLTVREVLSRARDLSLRVLVVGSGLAARQETTRLRSGTPVVKVYFEPGDPT